MISAHTRVAPPSPPEPRYAAPRKAPSGRVSAVRGIGVTYSGELVVACEVTVMRSTVCEAKFVVDVEFPEDARGLLAIASIDGGIAGAVTAIAVECVTSLFMAGRFDERIAFAKERGRSVVPDRVCLMTVNVREALMALPTTRRVDPPLTR